MGRRWAHLLIWAFIAGSYGLQNGRMDAGAIFWLTLLAAGPMITIVHEAAHAAVAALAGFRVLSVRIGRGPETVGFRLGHARWSLRRYLSLGGETNFIPGPDAPRGRRLAVYAAGAVANLVLGVAAFALAMTLDERLGGPLWLTALLMGLSVSNLVTAAENLWPTRDPGGPDSDGAQILDLFRDRAPGDAVATMDDELAFLVSIYLLTEAGQFAEAADRLEAKLQDWPNDPYLLSMLIHCASRAAGDRAALARYDAAVLAAPAGPPPPPTLRESAWGLLDANLAWSTIKIGGDLEFAEARSNAAMAVNPDTPEVQGTAGALKVVRGDALDGERLLLAALRKIDSSTDRADFCAYVAKARRALGDETAAIEAERLRVHILTRGGDPVPV